LVASAQDIVNMMSMFGLLQATMMGIDMIDSLMYRYIAQMARCNSSMIIAHLGSLGFGELTRTEMNRRLEKLHDENYIERETTVDGMKYYANESKQILSIKVDWEQIYKCDNKCVRDPLTSLEYTDVREYGDMISKMHQIVMPDDDETDEGIVSERDALIMEAVLATLEAEGKLGHNMLAVKSASQVPSATQFDVMGIIDDMYAQRLIDRSDFDEKYSLRT